MTCKPEIHATPLNRRSLLALTAALVALPMTGSHLAIASETLLTVTTADGKTVGFTLQELDKLPQHEFETETPWIEGKAKFSGPLLRNILAAAGAEGAEVKAVALNDYAVSIPFSDATDHGVIVASRLDGSPMSVREKGPLWVMYPFSDKPALKQETHYSRCIWQLNRLELVNPA
jgi:hypothetical protein